MSILSTSPLSPLHKESKMDRRSPTFSDLLYPLEHQLAYLPPLESGCNRALTYRFDHQIRALVYYHIETFSSGLDLLHAARCDPFVRSLLVPETGLGQSTFYEANASRGSEQMIALFERLYKKACRKVPMSYANLGELVAVDGSLIDACLSMVWADYRSGARKAKMHTGFDLNRHLPKAIKLTDGNGAERPFVATFVEEDQTAVVDRGYQDHALFDQWIDTNRHFVARIKANTLWEIMEEIPFEKGTSIFLYAKVLLGNKTCKMTHPVYLIGFKAEGKCYYIVTDRHDLSPEQVAFIFSLRWAIETFFAWWKRHMKVYHLISRNEHGVLVQLLAGLITYLLLVIYFHRKYNKAPSLDLLRTLRWDIRHDAKADILLTTCINIHIDYNVLMLFGHWANPHAIS